MTNEPIYPRAQPDRPEFPWMETFTGRRFYPLDPEDHDYNIADIARALSMTARFGGHGDRFYSVAEHSVRVSWALEIRGASALVQLEGLLHDACEAYLGDMPTAIKAVMSEYKALERRVDRAIRRKFNLPEKMTPVVHAVDGDICVAEAQEMDMDWSRCLPRPDIRPRLSGYLAAPDMGWEQKRAEFMFRLRYQNLLVRRVREMKDAA